MRELRDNEDIWSYRPRTSVWSTFGLAAFAALFGVTILLDDGAPALLGATPWLLALVVAGWAVFWLPRVEVGRRGLTLVNPLRTIEVPWEALIDVRTQYSFSAVTPNGSYRAWAAPGPSRHAALSATGADVRILNRGNGVPVAIGDLPIAPSGVVAAQVRRRWDALREQGAIELGVADDSPVTVTWSWLPLAAVAALVAIGVTTALL